MWGKCGASARQADAEARHSAPGRGRGCVLLLAGRPAHLFI